MSNHMKVGVVGKWERGTREQTTQEASCSLSEVQRHTLKQADRARQGERLKTH